MKLWIKQNMTAVKHGYKKGNTKKTVRAGERLKVPAIPSDLLLALITRTSKENGND